MEDLETAREEGFETRSPWISVVDGESCWKPSRLRRSRMSFSSPTHEMVGHIIIIIKKAVMDRWLVYTMLQQMPSYHEYYPARRVGVGDDANARARQKGQGQKRKPAGLHSESSPPIRH